MERNKKDRYLFVTILALVSYLLFGTGAVSDDFGDIYEFQNISFPDLLIPKDNFLNVPVGHLSHHVWFRLFSLEHPWIIDLFKIGFTVTSLVLIYRFFQLYLSDQNSIVVTFLFIFYPSHDSIPYWYAPTGHLFSIAIYLSAFRLAVKERLVSASILALIASFMVYGSTPTALALFSLFCSTKDYKRALTMLCPNLLYVGYFFYVSVVFRAAPSRILEEVTVLSLTKQYILQIGTFLDATIGPSIWFKIYYSWLELTLFSIFLGVVLCFGLNRWYQETEDRIHRPLAVALLVFTLSSFGMFAATGQYPQLCFNLGNRTTFWGSLLLAYLLVVVPGKRFVKVGLYGCLLFSALGISDHWKAWNTHQQIVISHIAENQDLMNLDDYSDIFISGAQYSRYGPFSHIEFLSEDWVSQAVIRLVSNRTLKIRSINRNHYHKGGFLINRKYREPVRISNSINVYDAEKDRLLVLQRDDINPYIESLPDEKRHWLQFEHDAPLRWLKDLALFLMPRLKSL